LHEYARWFAANGGALFIVHKNCAHLRDVFPDNRYFVVDQSRADRFLDDCGYLQAIRHEIGAPDLYYSYGIPLYFRFGRVNWFHLSNVLALTTRGAPLSVGDRLKFNYLGWLTRRGLPNADVISAESKSSLELIDVTDPARLFLSVNGSDDELDLLGTVGSEPPADVATAVGTYRYKGLPDTLRVFEMLKHKHARLELRVFGREEFIPAQVRSKPGVVVAGNVGRASLIEALRRSRYYISTTYVENSYNAASEGIFCAAESYVSDIGPHRELLQNTPFERVQVPGLNRELLHVKRENLSGGNLKNWDTVIAEMIARFEIELPQARMSA
jgi:hypothetical protein